MQTNAHSTSESTAEPSYEEALLSQDERFQKFLAGLPADTPVWFCFFSSGLLHVIQHFLRFVPPGINFAFLSSGLTAEEIALRNTMSNGRPAFDLDEGVGSHEIFEFLLRNLDRPFGIVDSDCFVMEADWFTRCMDGLEPGVAVSSPLSYGPIPLAAPPFMALDPAARPEIERAIGGPVSPAAYSYTPPGPEKEIDGAMVRLIEPHHEQALAKVLALEDRRLPFPQGGLLDVLDDGREVRSHERHHHLQNGNSVIRVVFDGLMFYQLMALAAGRRIAHFHSFPGTKVFAPQLVHAGGISYWHRLRPSEIAAGIHELPWSAHMDALLLERFNARPDAPESYRTRGVRLAANLRQSATTLERLREELRGKLAASGVDVTDPRWRAVLD
ncbi:dTDP-dihydrostreptose--streptidine-6-phosphate dihydrostreptosyltransferase [Streptomyces sparsogenes]|uniref:dTDP-dihydrostreptose--streptidine-6-phosphate dihydrostreptosyltransferase n=1 Tax=Streptomyces sparsogenes DSM 40356 TaxID=1331668 RepID=A0A1R1SFH8_9ACTN|nr:dTDP-dihydrostreptose--streptidine-6-phosphate dihydrostreptosyltransferase [Streptomyces sparsogenes]OMI37007.1 dTDP-dihydrostreptose--streptidine-6- phosphate dihydrostreptosyltransferase [Streptomyces sparsogenes DSM 40356]